MQGTLGFTGSEHWAPCIFPLEHSFENPSYYNHSLYI